VTDLTERSARKRSRGAIIPIVILLLFPCSLLPGEPPQKITKTLQGITFDSNYDNGSLKNVEETAPDAFDCEIYWEPGDLGAAGYWFRFRMNGMAGRKITLAIDHKNNPRPVVRKEQGTWRRMTDPEAPSTSRLELDFNADENEAEIAFFFPAGVGETQDRVNQYVRRCDVATSEVIGRSFQGRDIWMVTVTDPLVPDTLKHRVWMHARVHAGEVTSTLSMLGFLDLATEDSLLGAHLRRHIIFHVVPIVNIDGVSLGHTRWDSQGIDPEREWRKTAQTPPGQMTPETACMKVKVDQFMAGDRPIEVALNMHSTKGNYKDTFFWKHVFPSVTHAFEEIEQNYIDALDHATPLFDHLSKLTSQLDEAKYIESYFWRNWGEAVMAMTHEGHFYRRITDDEWITADDYHELGRAMALALIEYLDLPRIPQEYEKLFWMIY